MEFWNDDSPLQPTIILLVENISTALGSEFKIYLPQLIPKILNVLMQDTSKDRQVTGKLLTAIQKFGSTLADYLHLFLPPIGKMDGSSKYLDVFHNKYWLFWKTCLSSLKGGTNFKISLK